MEINTEEEFYTFTKKLFTENKITKEEYNAIDNYVCCIFDALSGLGLEEEDLIF